MPSSLKIRIFTDIIKLGSHCGLVWAFNPGTVSLWEDRSLKINTRGEGQVMIKEAISMIWCKYKPRNARDFWKPLDFRTWQERILPWSSRGQSTAASSTLHWKPSYPWGNRFLLLTYQFVVFLWQLKEIKTVAIGPIEFSQRLRQLP
jgi:hypothetical protein